VVTGLVVVSAFVVVSGAFSSVVTAGVVCTSSGRVVTEGSTSGVFAVVTVAGTVTGAVVSAGVVRAGEGRVVPSG
jgi:hypothetical protein